MRMKHAVLLAALAGAGPSIATAEDDMNQVQTQTHSYVGMWVTDESYSA